MATVFFLLDALRHDYVTEEHMPFLWRAAHEGTHYRRIIPGFGFCERSEILTGLTPRESGFFTAIGFDPVNSPYQGARGLSVLHALESLVPKNAALPGRRRPGGYYRLFRRLADRWLNRNDRRPLKSYHIPYRFLPYFALTEDRLDHRLPGAFPRPSLLDQMAEAGKSYYYDSFTALNLPSGSSDEDRLQLALDSSRSGEYDLFLIFVGELDSIGHHYGPDSAELHRSLNNLDRRLERFVQAFEGNAPGHRYVFLGDHGMGPVAEMFDAGAAIARHARRLGLKSIRDFLYFLDSTLVRIWTTDVGAQALAASLRDDTLFQQCGRFVDEDLAQQLDIPWGDRRYGDLLWVANQGVLVFPDFFHRDTPYRAMHGYIPEDSPDNLGACIVMGAGVPQRQVDQVPLGEVYHILRRSVLGE